MATFYTGSGPVAAIVTNDSSWGADADYFVLSGVTSLGTCPTGGGMVIFLLKRRCKGTAPVRPDPRRKASGAQVTADVDDVYKSPGGICYLRHLTE